MRPTPSETFEQAIRDPGSDPTTHRLRDQLTQTKLEALEQCEKTDESGLAELMPQLYEEIVTVEVQLASHVGLGVCLALSVMDEHQSGASISGFGREARQKMTDIGVELKRRRQSSLARIVAEIEAQRLAWRHSHEFLSWLAFRRGDDKYPPEDRLARLEAFKVIPRLVQTRDVVVGLLGTRLSSALEGCDRFFLANRWRLAPSPEHAIERYVWPLLSYQPGPAVLIERARFEYDARVDVEAPAEELETMRKEIVTLLERQLSDALAHMPASGTYGDF